MSALEAFVFGAMAAWTPSFLFLAFALWRAPLIGEDQFSEFDGR
jgi:hypothetical protein